jgi:hypothetical protein
MTHGGTVLDTRHDTGGQSRIFMRTVQTPNLIGALPFPAEQQKQALKVTQDAQSCGPGAERQNSCHVLCTTMNST